MGAADRLLLFSLFLFSRPTPAAKKNRKKEGGKRVDGDKLRFKAPCKRFGKATPKREEEEEDVSIEEHKRGRRGKGEKDISSSPFFPEK